MNHFRSAWQTRSFYISSNFILSAIGISYCMWAIWRLRFLDWLSITTAQHSYFNFIWVLIERGWTGFFRPSLSVHSLLLKWWLSADSQSACWYYLTASSSCDQPWQYLECWNRSVVQCVDIGTRAADICDRAEEISDSVTFCSLLVFS